VTVRRIVRLITLIVFGLQIMKPLIIYLYRSSCYFPGAGQFSGHSEWLRAGRPSGRSLSPIREKILLLSTSSRPVLGPTQTPIQWVPGALSPGVKWPGRQADHSPPTSAEVKKYVDLYTNSPIRLHSVLVNQLSTGTTLPSACYFLPSSSSTLMDETLWPVPIQK
jgi:hypothetical protein